MEYTPAQEALLVDLLLHGDNALSNVADNTEFERSTFYRVKDGLAAEGLIVKKGNSVWTLSNEGRREAAKLVCDSNC